MTNRLLQRLFAAAALAIALSSAAPARAAEVMCDPSFQDCRATLLAYIRNENVSIDIAMWFMEDVELANTIIARHNAGVSVRALVDPRRNPTTPMNGTILQMFANAGIPMRYKVGGGILHWKFMIFNRQNTLQFSAANYGDYYFRPVTPYRNYTDEGIYFGDDPAVVNSFRRKFDDSWVDTVGFQNYANVGTPVRAYPLYSLDPDMSFVPAENFATRSSPLYDRETTRIDVTMYKITEAQHADGLIRAVRRGVPVRLITEPDLYRNPSNVWQAYHVDRLYMAGVQIRNRAHAGFLHQKSTQLHSQGLSIFGSSNWTVDSNRSQYEHNYFTDKPWFFAWLTQNFERKWNNSTGNVETQPFTPLPPGVPAYVSPANAATGIATGTGRTISWRPGPWAHRADVYFGTSPNPPLLAANVSVSAGSTKSHTLPALASGTTYYWKIVSKTMADQSATGPVYSFRTTGDSIEPPPPPPDDPDPDPREIVLHAGTATTFAGAWRIVSDSTAASGRRMYNTNASLAKVGTAAVTPADYFEMTFHAQAGIPYRLWMRGKADSNSWSNDSVHVQFSGSVTSSGTQIYRIGTTSSTEYNLEACTGCGVSGWGWRDNSWGTTAGPVIYFAATGTQHIRIQRREDGLSIDQIAISAGRFLTQSPGQPKNDQVILPRAPQ